MTWISLKNIRVQGKNFDEFSILSALLTWSHENKPEMFLNPIRICALCVFLDVRWLWARCLALWPCKRSRKKRVLEKRLVSSRIFEEFWYSTGIARVLWHVLEIDEFRNKTFRFVRWNEEFFSVHSRVLESSSISQQNPGTRCLKQWKRWSSRLEEHLNSWVQMY